MISEAMDCKEAKVLIVTLLSGDISEREKESLLAHLATCKVCSHEKEGLERVWRNIGALPELEVPADLRDATLSRFEEMFQREKLRLSRKGFLWQDWIPKPLAAIFGGVAMAVFSLWVLRGVTALEQLSGEVVFLCAALWTGILAGTFLLATGSFPALGFGWQWASRVGLVSLGVTMSGTVLCPKMNLIHWWETLPPGQFLLSFGSAVSHGAFGIIYSFLPFSIALYFLGRKMKGKLLPHALSAGGFFLVLLLPAIYLQASPLSSAALQTWVAGSIFGILIGVLTGAGAYRLRSQSSMASG